ATLAPQTAGGLINYQAALPAGSIQGGNYSIQASGGVVGAFHATAQIPPPISITTNLAPGTTISSEILEIDWTGGDSRSLVTAQYLVRSAGTEVYSVVATVSAAGNLGVMLIPFGFP